MKRAILLAVVAVMAAVSASAQTTNGGMSANGRGFFMDGERISVAQAKDYSRQFPEAVKHIRTGQAVYGVAIAAALGGGYLTGYQLGRAVSGKGVNAVALGAGVVVLGGAFGLSLRIWYNKWV